MMIDCWLDLVGFGIISRIVFLVRDYRLCSIVRREPGGVILRLPPHPRLTWPGLWRCFGWWWWWWWGFQITSGGSLGFAVAVERVSYFFSDSGVITALACPFWEKCSKFAM